MDINWKIKQLVLTVRYYDAPISNKEVRPVYACTHRPVVELPVGPGRLPAPVLHSQGHQLQVAGVSVDEGRVHGFILRCAGLRLGGCLTQTPGWVSENGKKRA